MDNSIQIDYSQFTLEVDDILLLTSDGIHDFLTQASMIELISSPKTCQQRIAALVQAAF